MADLTRYQLAADSNNILNTGTSWTDPETWTNRLGSVGKFVATSLASGINSYYNTAAAIGNWAGADVEQRDTEKWISSLDADWGKYYRANKELADITGFVAGSIIPGLAGAKLLNIGQNVLRTAEATGKISGNLARVTGLLVTNKAKYLDEAEGLIKSSLTASSVMNAKTYQALASGVYQNTLEAMAGEILVTATMYKSPVLDDMSVGGIASNIMIGGALGGVIGGAVDAARTIGRLRKVQDAVDLVRLPWTKQESYAASTPYADVAIQTAYNVDTLQVPIAPGINATADELTTFRTTSNLYQTGVDRYINKYRTAMRDLGGGYNPQISTMLTNLSLPVRAVDGTIEHGFSQRVFENLSGAIRIAPINEMTAPERVAARALSNGATPDVPIAVKFVQLTGPHAGKMTDEMPKLLSLGDVHETVERINSSVRKEGFDIGKLFDMRTLTKERDYLVAERRYLWARGLKEIKPQTLIHHTDIPLLERAYDLGITDIRISKGDGPALDILRPTTKKELYDIIRAEKIDLANELHLTTHYKALKNVDWSMEAAARTANVREDFLTLAKVSAEETDDIFASQSAHKEYLAGLEKRALSLKEPEAIDPIYLPRVAKIVYAIDRDLTETTESVVDAVVHLKQQQQFLVEANRRVTAKNLGASFTQLPNFTERELARLNRRPVGAGLVTGANSGLGSPGQVSTQIGKVTANVEQQRVRDVTDAISPPLAKLGGKIEAAFEFESVNQRVGRTDKLFVRAKNTWGEEGLVDINIARPKGVPAAEWLDEVDAELLDETNWIAVTHKETLDVIDSHIAANDSRVQTLNEVNAARGHTNQKHLGVYRPIRPDPKDYPYFAFVYDERVTNSGHVAMIHAASEKELAELIDKVPDHFRVTADSALAKRIKARVKLDIEDYKKALGNYEFDRTLHENYINSELASKGVYSNYFPKSDPQKIINDVLQQHVREERVISKELIRLHYEPEFAIFEDMGKQLSKFATSKFASRAEMIEKTTDNPYFNLVKTALNISNISEHNLVYSANRALDKAASRAYGALQNVWRSVTSEADLVKINQLLDAQGMKPAYYDAALQALANHSAPKGVLTEFVTKANSMLSLFTLGLDPLNALNNAIGSNILRMTELSSVTRAIKQGNTALAGDLADLAKINLPGVDAKILAPSKLMANAMEAMVKDGVNGPLKTKYKSWGIIKDRVEQLALLIDDFTLTGTESVGLLKQKQSSGFSRVKEVLKSGAEQGEKWTGNKFAEEANRFISANVMDQITSLAIKHGIMDEKTAQAYINTFVNRVEGSIIASQRPLIFQGPIGQAIGLFQRYQFNLLQQLFRYIGEGTGKDIAMVAGLQSTLYGIQGLPAFQFINTHIVGQLSGNTEHRDAYSYTYGAVGKTAADFIMYGIPSNILQTNIYTRGDINPRHLTILPTTLQETPFVQGWGKFFGNIFDMAGKLGAGASAGETILQGIEHNGISRPLAGFAQVFQGFGPEGRAYSTSNRGSILYSNDLVSWASLVRMAGGRPLDEARVNDAMWRFKSYQAARKDSMASLGEVIKTSLIQGNEPDTDQINSFAEKYGRLGGKQEHFNKWMLNLYKSANVSQAEKLELDLKSPFNQQIQLLMGGDPPDEQ